MLDNIKPPQKPKKKPTNTTPDPAYNTEPKELDFKKPLQADDNIEQIDLDDPMQTKPKNKKSWLKKLTKKQWLVIATATVVLIAGVATGLVLINRKPAPDTSKSQNTIAKPKEPVKTTVQSRLTGVEIQPELNDLPTTAVQIENSPDARPQAGLYDAGIVTEAIAEGGITRFNAIFMEASPERIGPVRSLRPYYIDFFLPYDAAIAHAGGSGEALAQVKSMNLKDLDHSTNGSTYYRDSNRFAPHNLFTSRQKLLDLQRSKGWSTSTFSGLVRKAENKSTTPNARAIDVAISSFLYNPRFDYDSNTNSYLRSEAGKPHMDEIGKQINPKAVVVLIMPHHYEGIYSVYQTTGTGKAYIFQDGTVTEGVWEKTSRSSQIKLGDANGSPVGLNPGQTWFTLASTASQVKVTP